jgi:hypothetical protein
VLLRRWPGMSLSPGGMAQGERVFGVPTSDQPFRLACQAQPNCEPDGAELDSWTSSVGSPPAPAAMFMAARGVPPAGWPQVCSGEGIRRVVLPVQSERHEVMSGLSHRQKYIPSRGRSRNEAPAGPGRFSCLMRRYGGWPKAPAHGLRNELHIRSRLPWWNPNGQKVCILC